MFLLQIVKSGPIGRVYVLFHSAVQDHSRAVEGKSDDDLAPSSVVCKILSRLQEPRTTLQ